MHLRRLWLALPLGLLAALVLSMSAGAAGTQTFTDPTGDVAAGVPDVTSVVVSNDDNALLTFAVTLADPAALTGDNFVFIAIDADHNVATGRSGDGVEYAVLFDGTDQVLVRWNGSAFDPLASSTLARTTGTTFTLRNTDLGGTTAFNFYLVAFGPGEAQDLAPDGDAIWSYTLNLRPELESLSARFRPAAPRAGKVFAVASVSLELGTGENVRPTTYRCVARLAGKTLRATGRCRWLIPRNANRKRLVITITATYRGVTETFAPYSFRVRA